MPLQANSLSSITQLAGNPLRYPRNPTEQKRESLVLYIARVPGSRDVILTTMKPRLKNVTAEDVINSLYYLHVDTPRDVFLMGDTQNSETPDPILKQSKTPIARKPLREDSAAEVSTGLPHLAEKGQKIETTLSRAPSGALRFQTVMKPPLPQRPVPEVFNQKPPLPQRPSPNVNSIPTRRPLGPRPFLSQPETKSKPLPGTENIPTRLNVQQRAPVAGSYITKPHAQAYCSSETLNEIKPAVDSSFRSNMEKAIPKGSFSITLIRRDPTSGAQWNVGRFSNQSMLEDQASIAVARSNPDRSCSSVLVQLSTLGYGQFRAPLVANNVREGNATGDKPQELQDSQYFLKRQVRMTWSKLWERKYKQHQRTSSDQTGAWKSTGIRSSVDIPVGQYQSEDAQDGNVDSTKHGIFASGFLSPWNGFCQFSTGASGRTLKCKHTLNNSTTITPSQAALLSGVSAEVSELRFNLPSSTRSNVSTTSIPSHTATPKRPASSNGVYSNRDNSASEVPATSYAAIYPSDNDNDNEDDESDNLLDLSLGREKAGGGIRGKRAKLGKLLVHDEGLKMLDLVVAANMGIWWTVWDP